MSKLILGAGITGLVTARATGLPIYEGENIPGGICSSYYVRPGSNRCLGQMPEDEEAYRFEIGGGHWIFGTDDEVLNFIHKFTPVKDYRRRSAVYFGKKKLYVPYPIQNNLRFLNKVIIKNVLKEVSNRPKRSSSTMKEWLAENFGQTLCELFFWPFHNLYTTNLHERIAPQDAYKSPVDTQLVIQGANSETLPVGYNATFIYPQEGLNTLVQRITNECNINYGKRVVKIDTRKKEIYFTDDNIVHYNRLISTLPLNKMVEMTDLKVGLEAGPYTSVLVLNIGAIKGDGCPQEHWLYIPDSAAGFFRVGFYSNVDASFLPKSSQKDGYRVGIYVERAYRGGQKPSKQEIKTYTDSVVSELQKWGFIKDVEVLDPTWIDVAYTWSWPGSKWREKAIELLKERDIHQLGRYGRWKFQGIAKSIKEGLLCRDSEETKSG